MGKVVRVAPLNLKNKPISAVKKPATCNKTLIMPKSKKSLTNHVENGKIVRAMKSPSSKATSSLSENEHQNLVIPSYEEVGKMEPIRGTPRLMQEDWSDRAFAKRHDKPEKQERSIKRRDLIRQREQEYRMRLMKIPRVKNEERPEILEVKIVSKVPTSKCV